MKSARIYRAAGVVSFFTTMSRGLGLVRDVLMAGIFGTSLHMSAFVVAFTIPNLSRRLFGEGALSASFIPVFVETRTQQGETEAWTLARKIVTLAAAALMALTLLGEALIWTAPSALALSPKMLLILRLLRIMLPYMFFICLAALSMAILNSFGHFALPAATPCILNVVWILAALLVPWLGGDADQSIHLIAWAILLAGAAQLIAQFPVLHRFGYRPGISFDLGDARLRRVFTLMGPAAFGLALTQFNVLMDRLLASWVGPWAPAALFYSERLIYFPLGIFATALGTVLLPAFSAQVAGRDLDTVRQTFNQALRNLLFVMIPAAAGLLVLAHPIVEMIYQWKTFDAESTRLTALALQCYAPGLVVFSLPKVLVPVFYSFQDTRTPLKVGMMAVGINLALNLLFILSLPLYWKHAGIALGTILAELVFAVVLAVRIRALIGSPGWSSIASSILKVGAISAVMSLVAWIVARAVPLFLTAFAPKISQIVTVIAAMAAAMTVYFALAFLLRCRELDSTLDALRRRAARRRERRSAL